jgi:UDP-N-acetylmuramate--alanine ligase
LFEEFSASFAAAHHALILPIYRPSGREDAEREVTSVELVESIQRRGHPDARSVDSFDAARAAVAQGARPGDLVLTMGAGDVTRLADQLLQALA